jgi:S-formylglutathione hydrolase FrmB
VLETVAFVDATFRTIPDRRFRAIGGLSSGAFGAVNIASRHPDVFGIGMSFSGYFTSNGWVFRYIPAYIRANSPAVTVRVSPAARTVHYVVTCALADPLIFQARNFAAELRQLGVRVDTSYFPGGHTADRWVVGLLFALPVVGAELQPPPPPPPPPPAPELSTRALRGLGT